jgi:hypothetical protein
MVSMQTKKRLFREFTMQSTKNFTDKEINQFFKEREKILKKYK